MAIINPPAWMQQGSYPASTDRLMLSSIIDNQGVVEGFNVTATAPATMRVLVSAGKAFIEGNSVVSQGMYNVINDGSVELTVTPSNATYGRIDRVVLRIRDADVSGSVNDAALQIIAGNPSSSPVAPAIPESSIVLATITVAAQASSITTANINSSGKPRASLYRDMAPSVATVTKNTRPAAPWTGMSILETDTKQRRYWDGTKWIWEGGVRPYARMRKNNGFQGNLSTNMTSPTRISLSPEVMMGGFTTDVSAGISQLIIPEDGYYSVGVYLYMSGTASSLETTVNAILRNHNESNVFKNYIQLVRTTKLSSTDAVAYAEMEISYLKGWRVSLSAARAGGDAQTSVWGVPNAQGTYLSIKYLSPLP